MTAAPRPPVPILMYHEIAGPSQTRSQLAVPPGNFASQLGYLHDAGFQTITAGTLAESMNGGAGRLPERAVVLTFDDGFADFYQQALPLLARYGFTATLYVTTGWVQDAGPLPAGERPGQMLCWSQVAEVAAAGIEIGAHSRLHPQLDQLPRKQLREELRVSKAQLEDQLGRPVPGLAYPFGYSSAAVREEARAAGHGYACAVGNALPGAGTDPLALPRLTVRRSTSMPAFQRITHSRNVPMIFLKDRALTKGYAMVRRTRTALGQVRRGH
jgi:peptidoglycan/xylan/chitin deacetylase (PgdA/CDA1 family)